MEVVELLLKAKADVDSKNRVCTAYLVLGVYLTSTRGIPHFTFRLHIGLGPEQEFGTR